MFSRSNFITPTVNDWHNLEILGEYLRLETSLPERADAIVVGGAGALLQGAIRAAQLYHHGLSPLIVVSGFANPYYQTDHTEATIMKRELLRLQVPSSAILTEHQAQNTGQNITKSEELLRQQGVELKDVILVHQPFMTRRFLATALAQWPGSQPHLYVTSLPLTVKQNYDLYQPFFGKTNRAFEIMIGDYQRIKDYPALGFSVEQPVSEQAELAHKYLLDRGFTMRQTKG